MEHPSHLSAEQRLQRLLYVGVLTISEPAENFATWLLTGTGAILGLILVNIDSVSQVLSQSSLRWGLSLMTLSMLFGVATKQLGIAIMRGIALMDAMLAELNSPPGLKIKTELNTPLDSFAQEMASPFLPPFKKMMLNSFLQGGRDPLAGEKRYIKMFCFLSYFATAQAVFGAIGLLWLVCGIK